MNGNNLLTKLMRSTSPLMNDKKYSREFHLKVTNGCKAFEHSGLHSCVSVSTAYPFIFWEECLAAIYINSKDI